jgi:hypothetical protein
LWSDGLAALGAALRAGGPAHADTLGWVGAIAQRWRAPAVPQRRAA